MILEIIKHPSDILTQPTSEVESVTSNKIQTLIDNMIETMHSADGVGIAGPQVNESLRLTIIGKHAVEHRDDLPLEESNDLPLINPTWEKLNKTTTTEQEGCLSIPNTFGKVERWKKIKVKAEDRHGNELKFEASNYLARVIQHEVDHLEGTLFIEKAENINEVDPIEQAVKNR
jgi:peptide deformylase